MKIDIIKLPGSKMEIKGELPADAFLRYIKKTTDKIVAEAELDGFRKGKAPEKLVLERIDEGKILSQAAEVALSKEWPIVLEEYGIEAIGPAEFHILKIARGNELVWKATVAILPAVTLPDYKEIARRINKDKKSEKPEIEEKEVEETLAYIQRVRTPEGTPPPPLDDEYAKSLGSFATLEALKENIREGLALEKEEKGREEHRGKILSEVAAGVTVDIPDIMIENEQRKILEEMKERTATMGLVWADYLSHMKTSEEELLKGWHDDAVKRVRSGLALREIARAEHVAPTEEEISKHIETMLRHYTKEDKANLDPARVADYAKNALINQKILEFLETQ
jgi:FKBP-type peptidyl-prolyl cis-trans isomerase (trigger factor)